MWRLIAVVLTSSFLCVACGGDDAERPADGARPTPTAEGFAELPPPGPCPKGTAFVRARDVIGPAPAGFKVVAGDRRRLAAIAADFEKASGDAWRGYDAKVLARRNAANGTAVMVVNSHEATGSREDFLKGVKAAQEAAGTPAEPIQVAGGEASMQRTPDGAYLAAAPAGTCAVMFLMADTKTLVRRAASLLPAR
jgi:hypothetical protein